MSRCRHRRGPGRVRGVIAAEYPNGDLELWLLCGCVDTTTADVLFTVTVRSPDGRSTVLVDVVDVPEMTAGFVVGGDGARKVIRLLKAAP